MKKRKCEVYHNETKIFPNSEKEDNSDIENVINCALEKASKGCIQKFTIIEENKTEIRHTFFDVRTNKWRSILQRDYNTPSNTTSISHKTKKLTPPTLLYIFTAIVILATLIVFVFGFLEMNTIVQQSNHLLSKPLDNTQLSNSELLKSVYQINADWNMKYIAILTAITGFIAIFLPLMNLRWIEKTRERLEEFRTEIKSDCEDYFCKLGNYLEKTKQTNEYFNLLIDADAALFHPPKKRVRCQIEMLILRMTKIQNKYENDFRFVVKLSRLYRAKFDLLKDNDAKTALIELDKAIVLLRHIVNSPEEKQSDGPLFNNYRKAISYFNLACYHSLKINHTSEKKEKKRLTNEAIEDLKKSLALYPAYDNELQDKDLTSIRPSKHFPPKDLTY